MFLITHAHVHGSFKYTPKCMFLYAIVSNFIYSLHDIISLLKNDVPAYMDMGLAWCSILVLYLGGYLGSILVLYLGGAIGDSLGCF
jgi:hypothetical protein